MRILVITKRQYTNRDLIDDRFGRLRELPLALAARGHTVMGVCLSYKTREEGNFFDEKNDARVCWHSLNINRLIPWRAKNYWQLIDKIGKDFSPDLIWACSDAFHAVFGSRIARTLKRPLVIDLYDNFESFVATHLPGITTAFRRALRQAAGVTVVSRSLAQYVHETINCNGKVEIIENAIPKGLFHPKDRTECRREYGFSRDDIYIGTAGAISKSRGIKTLFNAFKILSRERPDVHLALAGPCDKGLRLPKSYRAHYLGILPQEQVPIFLSTLNVAVICNLDSGFGKYCFPQKFYEFVACGVPVVAAKTGAMEELMKDRPEHLYATENADDLAAALRHQINTPQVLELDVLTWAAQGKRLEAFFYDCIKATADQNNLKS